MPLETATYINQLDSANPLGSDPIAAGDDHIRLIKSAVKATFPNITGPVNLTQAQINALPTDLATAVTNVEADIEALSDTVDAQIAALGSMSAQNANAVAITGGTVAGVAITSSTVNGSAVGSNSVGARTVSSSAPTGGSNGDIWYQV